MTSLHVVVEDAPPRPAPRDMVWIPGGEFGMGAETYYPDEGPVHRERVAGFWIDRAPVTNAQFAEFVAATGYVTVAESAPRAGSLVFAAPDRCSDVRAPRSWLALRRGADWRHPDGPASSIAGLEAHPVVHVAYEDAEAYAAWSGTALPSEAEWEYAARGGIEGAPYAWGHELTPGGRHHANVWQGRFPWENLCEDGWERTSPVDAFPPNGYGLLDMIGNVWEWTSDWYLTAYWTYQVRRRDRMTRRPARADESYDGAPGAPRVPRKVIKGGSHLSAPNHCRRYRPAARLPHAVDGAACHVGFRCVRRGASHDTRAAW